MALTQINYYLLFLFGTALLTSMAGMEITSALILLTSLITFIKKPKTLNVIGKEIYFFLGLLFISVISLFVNGLFEQIPPTLGWFRWIVIFYGILYSLLNTPKGAKALTLGTLTGGLLSCFNSFVQTITHRDWTRGNKVIDYYADLDKQITRATGFFNMPTTYAYILAMFLFVSLTLFFITTDKKKKIIFSSVFLIGLLTLALTYSRGAWIGFSAGLFCFIVLRKIKLLIPMVLAIAIAASSLYAFSSGFKERIDSLTDFNYYSNSQRIELWKANLEIFKDHPIIGVGLNENDQLVAEYHDKMGHVEKYRSHAHNIYLQYLSGTGILGFLSFIALAFYFLLKNLNLTRRLQGSNQWLAYGLLSIQITFLVSGFFDCNFGDSEVRYSYLTYLVLVLFLDKRTKEDTNQILL